MTTELLRRPPADLEARLELLGLAHERLSRLAAATLRFEFSSLRSRHDPDSVLHRTWPRLIRALESTPVASQDELVRLAAMKIRQVLLDLIQEHRRRDPAPLGIGADVVADPPTGESRDPAMLAEQTEFHELVGRLPERERAVFELHYYLEMPQSEIARQLGLHPRQVSRDWVSAAGRIGRALGAATAR